MAKAQVGDKVRYIRDGWYAEGTVLYVIAYDEGHHMQYQLGMAVDASPSNDMSLWVGEYEFEVIEKPSEFNIGDKVRILDVGAIKFGASYWNNGDITEVVEFYQSIDGNDYPVLRGTRRYLPEDSLFVHSDEFHAIEKVEISYEYQVGDKIRVIRNVDEHKVGKEDVISYVDRYDSELPYQLAGGGWISGDNIELLPEESPLELRVSNLEGNVSVLTTRIHTLEREIDSLSVQLADNAEKSSVLRPFEVTEEDFAKALFPERTPNERRSEIIKKAKNFVKDTQDVVKDIHLADRGNDVYRHYRTISEFIVNEDKRTVVALIRYNGEPEGEVIATGIAKCDPNDVFNADIGKAIALGRAYGLDVSEFENAPQPDTVVAGMIVKNNGIAGGIRKCTHVEPGMIWRDTGSWIEPYNAEIVSDTEAQY